RVLFRSRDIFIDILCQHVERDVAALDDDIVEIAQIIFRAECRLRTPALADDFAVADLVSARLARPAAIAVDLACNFERVRSVALDEEADAFLARSEERRVGKECVPRGWPQ